MKMVFPTLEYKAAAVAFVSECRKDYPEINGDAGLEDYLRDRSYEEWLLKLQHVPKERVPAITYFYVDDSDRIIGIVDIRLALNDFLASQGGHVGYSVLPAEQGKGYATEMLRKALKVLKRIGNTEAVITCDRDNPASQSVIKKCGGELTHEFYSEFFKSEIQRYVIKL